MKIMVDEMPSEGTECVFGIDDVKPVFSLVKMAVHYTICCFTHEECTLKEAGCPFLIEFDNE